MKTTLLLFILLGSINAFAADRSVTLKSCEAYLLGSGIALHTEGTRQWLLGSKPLSMFVDKEQKPNQELNLIEMFDQQELVNDDPVEIAEAFEETRANFFAVLKSMGPTVWTQSRLGSTSIFASLE